MTIEWSTEEEHRQEQLALELRTKGKRKNSKRKGSKGELEIVELLRRYGWEASRRNYDQPALGGSDIIEGPAGVAIEAKRQERIEIWKWIAQCELAAHPGDTPVVAFRRNRSRWYCCLPLEDLLVLLQMRDRMESFE